eukprot:CAMPEP_0168628312 /NCGR_PEP_ID=MMETSP0449_2-20121227/11775_1 /TAXON_ID=1082188 /ORGANISM="Strombidium rassoulzadegani, Strain ras09" /LENGTH=145 /DNA_ID=CAMNT_0008670719 /DNA_START=46 /DNA_END=483 /DNA_ORIENTATION=+
MLFGLLAASLLNYLSGFYGPHLISDASFKMTKLDQFFHDKIYEEHIASFQFDLKADIRGLFNWNTNIIFLSLVCEFDTKDSSKNAIVVWDQRIARTASEHHLVDLEDEFVEYYLSDYTSSLKGKKVNVYLRWEQMTTVGPYYAGK